MKNHPRSRSCPPKPKLKGRPLISANQATALVSVFKALANDSRLKMLHALVRADELCVTDLAKTVGMKSQAVSNQLQRLSAQGILASRRDGLSIHYRIANPCVAKLLDRGLCLMEETAG